MAERDDGEKVEPGKVLNQAASYYVLEALGDVLAQKRRHKINFAYDLTRHLNISGALGSSGTLVPSKEIFVEQKEQVLSLAEDTLCALQKGESLKTLAREKGFSPRMVGAAPQALLFQSYLPLWENLRDVLSGKMEYGYGKDVYRLQPNNALAAGEMMKPASVRIANKIVEFSKGNLLKNFCVVEFGSGNGGFLTTTLKIMGESGEPLPSVIVTDIDENTFEPARTNFGNNGNIGNFKWMKIDMGNVDDVARVKKETGGKQVLIHIGYILHEQRELAERTIKALRQNFRGKNDTIFVFSEYFLQDIRAPEIPEWFQLIHKITQDLFKEDEFEKFTTDNGFSCIGSVVHNYATNGNGRVPFNKTLFYVLS